jgi:outer membrane protein OmpA-like peptidoglycan-associated protein
VGVVESWTSYREVWFGSDGANLVSSESGKVLEIAEYMKQNPSLEIGLHASDPRGQDLSNRRVGAVRDALMTAGVASSRIQTGAFGDTRIERDRQVEVLIKTGN